MSNNNGREAAWRTPGSWVVHRYLIRQRVLIADTVKMGIHGFCRAPHQLYFSAVRGDRQIGSSLDEFLKGEVFSDHAPMPMRNVERQISTQVLTLLSSDNSRIHELSGDFKRRVQ
jgi:hypothetical protein